MDPTSELFEYFRSAETASRSLECVVGISHPERGRDFLMQLEPFSNTSFKGVPHDHKINALHF